MISYEGRNRRTVNLLKTITFDRPEWTPCAIGLLPATWMKHREGLEQLLLAHPRLFPGFRAGTTDFDAVGSPLYELGRHTDCWGTVWENIARGLDSAVVGFPLADGSALASWRVPDPMVDDLFGPRSQVNHVNIINKYNAVRVSHIHQCYVILNAVNFKLLIHNLL